MVDGVALLSTLFFGTNHLGAIVPERESNNIDGGAPWYDSYECADGRYISLAGGEPQFFAALCELFGVEDAYDPFDRASWPTIRQQFAAAIAAKPRDEWAKHAGDPRLCLSPVLTWDEAPHNEHLVARGTFTVEDGIVQPAPAPRFSRTPGRIQRPAPWPGEHTDEILRDWGVTEPTSDAVRQRSH
jgi:alpha-methylacyl-CoA racemase